MVTVVAYAEAFRARMDSAAASTCVPRRRGDMCFSFLECCEPDIRPVAVPALTAVCRVTRNADAAAALAHSRWRPISKSERRRRPRENMCAEMAHPHGQASAGVGFLLGPPRVRYARPRYRPALR